MCDRQAKPVAIASMQNVLEVPGDAERWGNKEIIIRIKRKAIIIHRQYDFLIRNQREFGGKWLESIR